MADVAGVVLDAGVPASNRGSAPAGASAPADASALKHAGVVDMKMQWRGERTTAGGPNGAEIDNAASGIEAAFNYKVLPEIMVGALAQVDQRNETMVGMPQTLSQHGWMAGPVANVKLAPGLTFDASAAWGVAEGASDELARGPSTFRVALSVPELANTQSFGPWRISPSVSVNHFYEAASVPASAATHDNAVAYAAGGFGRVDVGPEFAYRVELDKSGYIEPRAAARYLLGLRQPLQARAGRCRPQRHAPQGRGRRYDRRDRWHQASGWGCCRGGRAGRRQCLERTAPAQCADGGDLGAARRTYLGNSRVTCPILRPARASRLP